MDGVDLDDQISITSIYCSAQECKIVDRLYSKILWSLAYDITFFYIKSQNNQRLNEGRSQYTCILNNSLKWMRLILDGYMTIF